jgi:hypothetical protein
MTNDLTFTTDSLFDNATFDKDAENWTFSFADRIYANASGFWRLFKNNRILVVSLDHGHKFGLEKPLDLIEEIKKILKGQRLTKIKVDKDSFDLTLRLTDQLMLVIYIASSAYETYDFSIAYKRYIGLGSGDIAIVDNP